MFAVRDLSQPTSPCRAYTDHMKEEQNLRGKLTAPSEALESGRGASDQVHLRLGEIIEEIGGDLVQLSHDIHDHPETAFNEHFAMARVADVLDRYGIAHADGVFNVPTALRAQVGKGTEQGTRAPDPETYHPTAGKDRDYPTFALLCEYDALPGIGHGCGHNVMCAQSVGAFLALTILERELSEGLGGRVVLQTTPAEEGATCKEILAQAGAFDDIDAAAMAHAYGTDVAHQTWLGVHRFAVHYRGVPSHASSAPFMGRNALDAATLALEGIALLRQQLAQTDRIHAVITDGGDVPNIIPEHTALEVYVRSKYPETLSDLSDRVRDIFRGAALMTGTGIEIVDDPIPNEMPVRSNNPLLASWVRSQRERGREPLPFGVVSEVIAASTDFGNVSVRIPGIHPLISVGDPSLMLHTKELAAAAGAPSGDAAVIDGAYGLAVVAADYLADAALRSQVHDDFQAAGGVIDIKEKFSS